MIPLHFCKPRVNFQQKKKDATACSRATTTFFSRGSETTGSVAPGPSSSSSWWWWWSVSEQLSATRWSLSFFSLNLNTTNKEAERHVSLRGGGDVVAAVFCIDVLAVACQRGPYTTTGMTRRSQRPEEKPRHTVPLHLRLAIYEGLLVFYSFFPFTFFCHQMV